MSDDIEIREMDRSEFGRIEEIDRTERIDVIYRQHGTALEEVPGEWDASPWRRGDGEHSVAEQHRTLMQLADAGGIALGAFAGPRLVGIGVVVPHLRPGVAQLAYIQVSDGFRGTGIGGSISNQLERIALEAGDAEMVVSATPSVNTVRFYMNRGFEPTATPLPELFELEPEDIHLEKRL
ncbi:MAG TPA: GNAT family N-acetyltransferase [Acidimicrobiia bacterium]|nr:GNAT family N-acetyltransferase [Acidimicrobiia bacterium]